MASRSESVECLKGELLLMMSLVFVLFVVLLPLLLLLLRCVCVVLGGGQRSMGTLMCWWLSPGWVWSLSMRAAAVRPTP